MKKIICIFCVAGFTSLSFAAGKHAGGVMLGEPTGLNYRYQYKDNIFIESGLDYRLGDRTNIYGSYNLIAPKSLLVFGQVTKWYYGVGARLKTKEKDDKDETFVGARGAVGLLYTPKSQPFELFAQVAPVFNLIPETSLDLDFNIGARFVF